MLYALFGDKKICAKACRVDEDTAHKYIKETQTIEIDFDLIAVEYDRALIFVLNRKGMKERNAVACLRYARELAFRGRLKKNDTDDIDKEVLDASKEIDNL